jgi:2-polyprenyl-3-methyl-5-hydroxy-6-metoxy-1,4-benzoquinol methylase
MLIPYRDRRDYRSVDIEKLRPKGSYGDLIAARTHSIDRLVREHGSIPQDLLKTRPCPGCSSIAKKPELAKDHLQLVRCLDCDLVYVDPIFDEEHYETTYRSEEYQQIGKALGEESHLYRVERFGAERVDIMRNHLPGVSRPRFLDVGCSTGFVVEAAQRAGWDAQGLDLNPSAIAFGQRRGLRLHNLTLEDFPAPESSFDAIGLFDVLEHLAQPRQVLERVVRLLAPGGIVFIYVPNYDSASRLLMGAEAHFIWPTHHLTYFTPRTIQSFVQSVGAEVETTLTEGLDIVDYLWSQEQVHGRDTSAVASIADHLQFFINASLYGKNLRVVARRRG